VRTQPSRHRQSVRPPNRSRNYSKSQFAFSPPTMPPSAFKPPRATLRAEHRNRSVDPLSDSEGVGLTPVVPPLRGTLLATLLPPAAAPSRSEWTADAGRAPSDDDRRGTRGQWHPACRRAPESLTALRRINERAQLARPGDLRHAIAVLASKCAAQTNDE
jgi:hypothetical protein